MDLKTFRQKFDPEFSSFLDKKIASFRKYKNQELIFYFDHLKKIFSKGKRLRPYLAYLSYKAYGGKKDNEAIKLFLFLEIFHAFALVHDDIMDEAKERHSVKTIHQISESAKLGNSTAILIGDFLLNWAFELLLTNKDFEKARLQKIEILFLEMVDEVAAGQFIDVIFPSKKNVTSEEIDLKTFLKTSGYSFINPLKIGKALVVDLESNNFFKNFGTSLGLAFQTQDDLFDIIYDSSQTNKSSFNDIQQGQHTIFTNHVFTKGTKEQRVILQKHFGKKISLSDEKKLRKIFYDSGAVEYGEKIIKENFKKAKTLLIKENMIESYKNLFKDLIDLIERRKS